MSTEPRTIVPEKDNKQGNVEMVLDAVIDKRFQEKKNGSMLIFDFDQAITNQPMCSFFVPKGYSDYNSGEENAVTRLCEQNFVMKK